MWWLSAIGAFNSIKTSEELKALNAALRRRFYHSSNPPFLVNLNKLLKGFLKLRVGGVDCKKMEPEPSAPKRKVRFQPKAPVVPKATLKLPPQPKIEAVQDVDAAETKELLRRINESSGRGRGKVEKKAAPVQVAFGQGGPSSFIRSYGNRRSAALGPHDVASDGNSDASCVKPLKEYKEPWNYYTYYPVTAPLRRPYSGDPALLDEEEFGEDLENITSAEDFLNPAEELGLANNNEEEEKMLFFQLPSCLPFDKSAEANVNPTQSSGVSKSAKGCSLEVMPRGLMGKLLVYKGGRVKLKLGDTLYDVSPGSQCIFAQDVAEINIEKKHCCVIGELNNRATVTPDIDFLLSS